jgi:AmmeMemoRadiSam system protein B
MPAINDSSIRSPAVAGQFYPAEREACHAEAQSYLKPSESAAAKTWLGGILPHAGWICSGAVAGQAIATVAKQTPADLVVIFGAVHTPLRFEFGALDSHAAWWMPAGEAQVCHDLYQRLLAKGNLFGVEPRLHAREHSVEVLVPMVQLAFPNIPILPIEVPPAGSAPLIGRKTAEVVKEAGLRAVYFASSDLTHYGTNYGFTPVGIGPQAMDWEKENDRRLLKLITELSAEKVVPEAQEHYNACGAGAIAAMLAAARAAGATTAQVLWHTNSYETLREVHPQPPTNAVGYAGVVVG